MAAECNKPINVKSKYLRNSYDMNNHKKNKENILSYNIGNSNINIYKGENYMRNDGEGVFKNPSDGEEDECNDVCESGVNNNFNNSFKLNKPFHREKGIFPI